MSTIDDVIVTMEANNRECINTIYDVMSTMEGNHEKCMNAIAMTHGESYSKLTYLTERSEESIGEACDSSVEMAADTHDLKKEVESLHKDVLEAKECIKALHEMMLLMSPPPIMTPKPKRTKSKKARRRIITPTTLLVAITQGDGPPDLQLVARALVTMARFEREFPGSIEAVIDLIDEADSRTCEIHVNGMRDCRDLLYDLPPTDVQAIPESARHAQQQLAAHMSSSDRARGFITELGNMFLPIEGISSSPKTHMRLLDSKVGRAWLSHLPTATRDKAMA